MKKILTQEEKFLQMTQTPIPSLICRLSVPTIISMMVTSLYNMADTFFVGQISTSATAAVGVVFSLMAVIQALGFTFGHGSGNYMARALGSRETKTAEEMAATGFFSALIVSAVLAVLGLIFLDPLVRMLGATETILPHARAYAGYILIGMPWMVAALTLNNQIRYQGNAFYAMCGIASGAVLNVVLDPLFIFTFDMGVGGAALATILSQFVSFCILLANTYRGGNIPIRLRNFKPSLEYYRQIARGGLPSFYRQGLASAATIFLNLAAGPYGDAAIAAMGIVNRVSMFASSAMLGFGQGFQPVCGFNYGAKLYHRVQKAFWFCVKVAVGFLAAFAVIEFLFAPQIVAIFRRDDADVIQIGATALRFQCITLPLTAWIVICNMMCQTIGKALKASVLAMARQGLFFLPLIWLLPHLVGLTGVQISQPVSDFCSFLLAVPMGVSVLQEMRRDQEHLDAQNREA